MKTLHFDCSSGISGDMTLAALVGLGVDPAALLSELGELGLKGWKLEFVKDIKNGIVGTRAIVTIEEDRHHDEHHRHHHWKEIKTLIEKSGIKSGAKERALAIFSLLAEAEAEVHGVSAGEVAFHEVGALDSIIDIVGTAVCLDILAPDRITAGTVELGGGAVRCAHGILPVPAPATLRLCRGIPVHSGGFDREMTTPTGAAILASQIDEFITEASFRELKTGYGAGSHNTEKCNMLRVSWRETAPDCAETETGYCDTGESVVLEANIDDMTGEELGFLMDCLFRDGARDVIFIPCVMKKSRPGTLVSVLCPKDRIEVLRQTMFLKSKTIGIREMPARCFALSRVEESVDAKDGGSYRKKISYYRGEKIREKIEYDDRASLARKNNIPLWEADAVLRKGGDDE